MKEYDKIKKDGTTFISKEIAMFKGVARILDRAIQRRYSVSMALIINILRRILKEYVLGLSRIS